MEKLTHLPQARSMGQHLLVCAQPTPEQWDEVKAAGAVQVISLCQPHEHPYDEAQAVAAAGLRFISIPVAVPDGVNAENAALLHDALAAGPSLVHCSTGNRAAALLALRAYHHEQQDADQAFAVGCCAGLTKLQPLVKQRLEEAGGIVTEAGTP